MKKLLLVLLLLCLCACGKKDEESSNDIPLGFEEPSLSIEEEYPDIVNDINYIEDNLDEYIKFYGEFETSRLIRLVNEGILTSDALSSLKELYASEYYVDRLEDKYLEYFNEYDDVRLLLEIVNTNRYKPLYSDIKQTDLSKDYLMLINKYYQLPSDYEPSDLVDIDPIYGVGMTRSAVYDAFVSMADDAYQEGYDLSVCSGYRSYAYQEGLYNKYLDIEGGNVQAVDSYSARAGHSEHQSGLCLDIVTPGYSMDDFGLSEASSWVNENCYKYGFIIRYTDEKEYITGYEAEAWQVRYVGNSDIAKYIMDSGITFDEYYTCFVE